MHKTLTCCSKVRACWRNCAHPRPVDDMLEEWCRRTMRQQQRFLVFWHDAVAPALAADVTQGQGAKPGQPEARRRAPTHIAVRKSNLEVNRRRHARPHPHHPVILTHSQDGTSMFSFTDWHWRMRRAAQRKGMVEGSNNLHLFASAAAANPQCLKYLKKMPAN
jgi:hypothetical protein